MSRDNAYLSDILDSARIGGQRGAQDIFSMSCVRKTQDAVKRRFELIGEAARSSSFIAGNLEILLQSFARNPLLFSQIPNVWELQSSTQQRKVAG